MTPERCDAIRARLAAVGNVQWTVSHRCSGCTEYDDEKCGLGLEIEGIEEPILRGQFARAADAQLIAHAPTDLRDLLALVDTLTAERDRLRAAGDAMAEALDEPVPFGAYARWGADGNTTDADRLEDYTQRRRAALAGWRALAATDAGA